MAMEQYFQETLAQISSNDEDKASLEKWKSVSDMVDGSENYSVGGFDCNICMDSVQDPVVTLCGHLYCWPCIYKWIHYQSVSAENPNQQQPQCPVCKAEVSRQTLVPLYGRGQTTKPSEGKAPHLGIVIPRRPSSPRCGFQTPITPTTPTSTRSFSRLHHRGYTQQPQPYYSHPGTPTLSRTDTTTTNVGMLGEMVYARIFGNSESTLYTYPNSYDLAGSSSPRMRRHLVQADKSLSRVCFFFCCCLFLCLLLF